VPSLAGLGILFNRLPSLERLGYPLSRLRRSRLLKKASRIGNLRVDFFSFFLLLINADSILIV